MRRVKRFFSMYSADFWVFILVIAGLSALISYSNNDVSLVGRGRQDAYLGVFSAATVICVFLIQRNLRKKTSLLAWIAMKAGAKFESKFSRVMLTNYHASVLTLAALLFVFAVYTLSAFIIGRQTAVLAALSLVLLIIIASLYICVTRGIMDRMRYLLIGICMVFPLVITLATDDYNAGYMPNTYAWIIAAITFSMLLVNRQASRLFFKLFAIVLFIGIFCELRFNPNIDFIKIVGFVSNIFYTGFVIFAPMDLYVGRSIENYTILENINRELQETQTQLVQREQMVTLGQLIAGVAHEINTPIGAIKASAETMDTLDIGRLLKNARRFDDDSLEALITVLDMCSRSAKTMRSTSDIRRGRAQVRKFMQSIDVARADEICATLAKMEICDVEKIETNMDLFRRGDIMEILSAARALKPYITSLQSIKFASSGVTKIIFALKSFSHMNTTGERHQFDIAKNIDNVLVLYHNQIKRGIEVIRHYDDDIPLVYGNVEELSQVWTNIIQNAIYAMSHVGRLIITVKKHRGNKVSVSFTDTGTGISQENIDKLFVPFFTTKPLGEGSGLGLDICKKVVEKHNGEIKVRSQPGQGATFTVTLPVSERERPFPAAGR